MTADISVVVETLKERAALKPSPERAREALEALGRILSGCNDEEETETGLPLIRGAQRYIETKIRDSRGIDETMRRR